MSVPTKPKKMKKLTMLAAMAIALAPVLAEAQSNRPGQQGQRPPSGGSSRPQPGQPGTRPPGPAPVEPGRPSTRPPTSPPTARPPATRPPSRPPTTRPPNRPPAARPPSRPPSARPPHRPGTGRPPHFRPVHRPPFHYPPGFRYRRWAIGGLLPLLFLSNNYFFNDWHSAGLGAPPPGHRWVRFGPDLLLVDVHTRRVVDVIYGAFY